MAANEFLMDHLRHGNERQARIQQVLKLGIATRNCIADHHHVGRRGEIALAEGLQNRNSERLEKR